MTALTRIWNKVLLMGDDAVGKTSIVFRFCDDEYQEQIISTIGTDFRTEIIPFPRLGIEIAFRIWDTAGLPQFRPLLANYLLGTNLILIVFDVTNQQSFENVRNIYYPLAQTNPHAIIALVGNKTDLVEDRKISKHQAETLANELGIAHYFEVSAKEISDDIRIMFENLGVVLWMLRKASEEHLEDDRKSFCAIS